MPDGKKKGTRVWISAFLSFLAALNVFNAVMLLTLKGSDFIIELSIMDIRLSIVSVLAYFLISATTTFVLLGVTFLFMFRGLPADPDMLQRLSKVEASLTLNANMLENMQIGFFRRLEDNEKATDEALQKMNISLGEVTTKTNEALANQGKALQDIRMESKKSADIVKKQATEVTGVRKRVERIEKALSPAKTKLTSKSKLGAVKGVKPSLAEGLKTMGITRVGQFLTTDPSVIAQKTMELHETVTNLQSQTQLLMVPGIDPDDAELLVKAGITSRKELAEQDPVQLCCTIANVADAYTGKGKISASRVPTVEEAWSWIRSAKP